MTSTEPRARLRTDDLPGNTVTTGRAVPAPPRRRDRRPAIALGAVLPVLALVAGIAVKLDHDAGELALRQAAHDRAVALAADHATDQAFQDRTRLAAMVATGDDLRAATLAEAQAAADQARTLAVAADHAGAENLAALQAAAQTLDDSLARLGSGASPATVRADQIVAVQAGRTVQQAEDAWQQAEQDRLAAEQAAREAEAARQRTVSAPRVSSAAPAAASSAGTSWAAGVQSYGIGGLGATLNQRRADAGLNTLTVVGSSSLADHAAAMAAAGSIWHSGHDHIVGWVEPVSDAYMIQAYLDSPPHRAWILKEGISQVAIGAVTINGILYTAMVFS